jgi:uncharacterized protein
MPSSTPTPSNTALRIPVADLLRRPGASRDVHVEIPIPDLHSRGGDVDPSRPVVVDATLERISDGVVVRGRVAADWTAACSRCLSPVSGHVEVHVDELYEPHPLEGETYGLDGDVLDLEPLVRDALLLELPNAPLCRDDCAGLCPTCGADRNVTACDCRTDELDPRWAALRSLDL